MTFPRLQTDSAAFPADRDGAFDDAHRATIGCVVPARNEEESIAGVLESLLSQTRVPDVIHVVVYNTSDATVTGASRFAGAHTIATESGVQFTEVFVHDIGDIPDRRAGALSYGHALVEGCDYVLGVDGGTIAGPRALEDLMTAVTGDPARGRNTRAVGGPFSLSSTHAPVHSTVRLRRPGSGAAGATRFVRVVFVLLLAGSLSLNLVRRQPGCRA